MMLKCSANETMDRTTIALPRDLHRRLRVMAAERGISMTQLIRETMEELAGGKLRKRPAPHFGIFDSGHSNTTEESAEMRFEPRTWRSS